MSLLGIEIAKRLQNGDVIGLGSGKTAEAAILEIGKRIASEKLTVFGVPTSLRCASLAAQAGIHVLSATTPVRLSWAFDGADEVDGELNLLKGRGGAMLLEKIIARRAKKLVIIVTEEKLVTRLGERFPIPLEVIPEAEQSVIESLLTLGAKTIELRESSGKYGPITTEHNNLILDVSFETIRPALAGELKAITGVVETGLFFGMAHEVLVERKTGLSSLVVEGKKVVERKV